MKLFNNFIEFFVCTIFCVKLVTSALLSIDNKFFAYFIGIFTGLVIWELSKVIYYGCLKLSKHFIKSM